MTSHQCATLYSECDPEKFLNQLRSNVTETITTTAAPMLDAFNDLVTVTASTLNSLANEENQNVPNQMPLPNNNNRLGSSEDSVHINEDNRNPLPVREQHHSTSMHVDDRFNPRPLPMRQQEPMHRNGFQSHFPRH